MVHSIPGPGELADLYRIEHDWLFEKISFFLGRERNITLSTHPFVGIEEYISELGLVLAADNPGMQVVTIALHPGDSLWTFLERFTNTLMQRFPDVPFPGLDKRNFREVLSIPGWIAGKRKIRLGIFIVRAHFFCRFKNAAGFFQFLAIKARNLKGVVFLVQGKSTPEFNALTLFPGRLTRFGQRYELQRIPLRMARKNIQRLFLEQNKCIEESHMDEISGRVRDHPVYGRLLVWHCLIRCTHACSRALIKAAWKDLIHHHDLHFRGKVTGCSEKQMKLLEALSEGEEHPYSRDARKYYQLGTTAHVAKMIQSLEDREIIRRRIGEIAILDPVFEDWLRMVYFPGFR